VVNVLISGFILLAALVLLVYPVCNNKWFDAKADIKNEPQGEE